jgi:subtilisin family serine protease
MQSSSLHHRRLVSTPLALGFLLLLLGTSMFFAPRSQATRPMNTANGLEMQATAGEKRRRPEFVPGEALVRFKKNRALDGPQSLALPNNDASVQAFQKSGSQGLAAATEQVLVNVERFEGSDLVDGLRIARMAPDDTLKAVAAFSARDDVLYAEPNYILHAGATPDDPSFNQLYGMTKIGAPQVWDTTPGSRSVVVGVIDEGIDISHPDLLANIWTNPSQGSIPGISGDLHGYDFFGNTGTIPAELHATHVAGTIGAVGNNGEGVAGVNWQVSLMSLRFISAATNSGTDADAIRAYNYAKQMRDLWVSNPPGTKGANIRALNASYGGGGYSQAAADALNAVGQSGILFVAAAGNETSDNNLHPHYPSNYSLSNVISVAATDQNDQLATFSNFGSRTVTLGAPGVGILSTTPGNTYNFLNGTSMATPHVTGAAALLCAANPNLSVNQLRALLSFNGDIVPALQGRTLSGRRLNVFKSLQAMNEGDTTPPGTVGGFQIASQNGRTVNLSWTASGDDGAAGQASLYDISFVDQTTSAVVPLTSMTPAISGAAQNINVNLPYRHLSGTIRLREFDNVGNEGTAATVPVNVSTNFADPYVTSLNPAAALSTGGTPLGLTFDDRYKENYSLPFAFPFFGQPFNTVTISTNGNLYFSTPPKRTNGDADDVPSSTSDLSQFKMIAGMWDDLDLSRGAGADVYVVQPDAARIIFRWQGVQFEDGSPINFEIELRNDGTVITRYGAGNTNLFPVVGISAGEPDPYVMDALTSELSPKSLTNAQSALFTPRSACAYSFLPTSQNFGASGGTGSVGVTTQGGCNWNATSNATWITITAGASGAGNAPVNYSVADNNTSSARIGSITIAGQTFTVNQDAPTIQFNSPTFTVGEGNSQISVNVTRLGNIANSVSVAFATSDAAGSQNCNTANGKASARCDYLSALGTLTFAAGETSKTISILIIDDAYVEGDETFTVNLSNPSGALLGSQSTATVKIVDNDTTPPGANPLDSTGFFVRQQYLDFLSREPDTSGLNFWTGNINNCSPQPACLEIQRINTSAAFFLSVEFQDTGYLVERIYKAAYGNANGTSTLGGAHQFSVPIIRFNEFLPDTQEIGQGVVVNVGNWQQQLENNKQAFTAEFVQRSRFTTAFPTSMTPAQFVDALNTNSGNALSPAERDQLVSDLSANVKTRSQVLRAVAEDPDLNSAEFNRAFVLMQYFGCLRRNPNDIPDTDYTGYDFWLTKLNQFNGNYVAAEMVKSFLVAGEYRQRFGP